MFEETKGRMGGLAGMSLTGEAGPLADDADVAHMG
jgi:hypothetical protein